MGKVQQLRRRIRSVRSTRQITKTMEMVSASKLKRAQDRVVAARPFATMMREVIGALDVDPGLIEHPLMRQPAERRAAAVFVFTSNRGLAGAFNANLVKRAQTLRSELEREGLAVRLHLVGKKGAAAFRYRGDKPESVWTDLSDRPSFEEADRVSHVVVEEFAGGAVDEVWLVAPRFNSPVDTPPTVDRILPIGSEAGDPTGRDGSRAGETPSPPRGGRENPKPLYLLTPSAEEIFTQLLPLYVRNSVYRALTETAAAEHGARRTAMKNATDNAGEILDDLNRTYNRARQAQITQEIAELLGGAEALRG
ncbi:MAG: ATP synthase F1 subunit gamma [Gemmatimonadetes bacterium]|nr:ATP synthase F1 subunit gamma [Gemmatimonadota bacterium]